MVNIGYTSSTVPTNESILYISLVTALNFYSYILDSMCCSVSDKLPSLHIFRYAQVLRNGLIVNIDSILALYNTGYIYATWVSNLGEQERNKKMKGKFAFDPFTH